MRKMTSFLLVLLVASSCFGQTVDLENATTPKQFRTLAREIEAATNEAYFSARERIAKKALAVAEEDVQSSNAEGLLHWILSGKTNSPTAHKAAKRLVENHTSSQTSVRRLLSYAQAPSGCTPELFQGFAEADLPDEHRWIVSACSAIHEKSLLLIADELAAEGGSGPRLKASLGQELTEQLVSADLQAYESRVIAAFEALSKQHGKRNMGGLKVAELCEGAIFEVRHLRLGRTASNLSGESVNGDAIDLSAFRGKVVLIDFWATWCAPCAKVMPELRSLQNELGATNFSVLGVSADTDKERLSQFIDQYDLQWPIIFDRKHELQNRWQAMSLPSYYVLDQSGVVRYRGEDHRVAANTAKTLLGAASQGMLPPQVVAEMVKSLLANYDSNQNQQIERTETPDELKGTFDLADTDKNGTLSASELTNLFKNAEITTESVPTETTPAKISN